jgi:aspartate racemase
MNTLGMIGGTSWHSTIEYYRLLNEGVGKKIGTHANPPLLLYSLNVELMREGNQDKIKQKYLEIATMLQNAGAEAIIICANTPHLVFDYISPKINIPILHIAEATGRVAKEKGLRKLGLLGTKPTMLGTFIPSYLQEHFGIETIIPDQAFISEIHEYISKELTQGKFTEAAKTYFLERIADLGKQGADGVILGCTELPLLLKEEDLDFPLLDTTKLHVELATEFILNGVDHLSL